MAVIGAGPCALAVVARLVRDARAAGLDERELLSRTAVLDPAGAWLAAWHEKLAVQRVRTLRSPSFVHPHPSRVIDDALRAFAAACGREHELTPLDAAGHRGWATPSVGLFSAFCASIVQEHGLDALVRRATAVGVRRDGAGAVLELADGSELRARFVVLALGAAAEPVIPSWARALGKGGGGAGAGEARVVHLGAMRAEQRPGADRGCAVVLIRGAVLGLLSLLLGGLGVPPQLARARRRLLIVGGGLSAAQLALRATDASAGWAEVVLCARAPLAVRPFDVGAAWMGRHWSGEFCDEEATFFRAQPQQRADLLRAARPGGSVTPEVDALLRARARRPAPRRWRAWAPWRGGGCGEPPLRLLEGVEVVHAERQAREGVVRVRLRDSRGAAWAESFDEVWLATGQRLELFGQPAPADADGREPPYRRLFASLDAHWPSEGLAGGWPVLTPSLQWAEGAPVYVCGALSALQVGPDAFNLAGAGAGAARIAREILPRIPGLHGRADGLRAR